MHDELTAWGTQHGMTGLVLIATEGMNGTVAGSKEAITEWKQKVEQLCGPTIFKDSFAERAIFKRWSVKVKPEIVAIKQPSIKPQGEHKHLSPEEWNAMLQSEDVTVLDVRNDYEVAIGKFKGAIDPQIKKFHEFPTFVEQANLPKEKKVLMYCTGGIRCEKALLEMERQGYEHVYQLEGGILAYLEQFPNAQFEGECFVFDHRVAVDQELKPSQTFRLCERCGDPTSAPQTCVKCVA